MSLANVSASWFKQNLSWSNSAEAWIERGINLAVLLALAGLLLFGSHFGTWTNVVAWGVVLVTLAVLMRLGWVKLLGPVLFYDMLTTARRGRYSLIRCIYAGVLLLVLFWAWSLTAPFARNASDRGEAAGIAMAFFSLFTVVQTVAVFLLTPAYVAGAIADEKERKTLEFLLATDLRNREIVLSKLGSRLCNLGMFILTGLPILSFLQFLGGVDPDLVLASFAATGLSALGLASVSILNSVAYKRPRDAIALTYIMAVAYLATATTLYGFQKASWPAYLEYHLWPSETAPTFSDAVTVINAGNIIAALFEVGEAGSRGTLATVIPELLWRYFLFHGTICLVCIGWSIAQLRRLALKQSYGRAVKLRWYQRFRPPVGELPVLWKELNVEGGLRFNWLGRVFILILVLLTLGIGVWVLGYFLWDFLVAPNNFHGDLFEVMNVWIRIAGAGVAFLLLMGVAIRAATTIRSEMDRDTFDALVTTPLSSDAILLAKFVGSLFSVRLGWFWLGAMLGLALVSGGMHVLALPLFLGAWVIYAVFFALVGLWFSMVSRTTMRAVVYTMLTTIGLSVGHWMIWMCCGPILVFVEFQRSTSIPEYLAKFQAGMTPPFVMGFLAYSQEDLARNFNHREFAELFGFSLLGLFLCTMASLMMWFVLIGPRFRSLTRRNQTSSENE